MYRKLHDFIFPPDTRGFSNGVQVCKHSSIDFNILAQLAVNIKVSETVIIHEKMINISVLIYASLI